MKKLVRSFKYLKKNFFLASEIFDFILQIPGNRSGPTLINCTSRFIYSRKGYDFLLNIFISFYFFCISYFVKWNKKNQQNKETKMLFLNPEQILNLREVTPVQKAVISHDWRNNWIFIVYLNRNFLSILGIFKNYENMFHIIIALISTWKLLYIYF